MPRYGLRGASRDREKAHAEPISEKEFDMFKAKKPAWPDLSEQEEKHEKTPKVE